ncbi:Uncharacterised protein [Neisseria meningitidis]|nr:Uncharacterised protein [Neisseria meningitidis]CWN52412.1 Uncharacterised protein [Neisseria meningitidis]CWP17088.1 Uncharacterised protein [Neisseria meningitidis]CWP26055.1 Uncharacterised protein [Neisseria meningitidis]CWP99008.1 Uncharacterised protein [Neisseria meningitidis]
MCGFFRIGGVVAADVGRFALYGGKLGNDFRFVGGQSGCQWRKCGFQFGIFVLRRQFLRPVEGEVEMAAAVVEFAGFTFRRFVVQQQFFGGCIQSVGEDLGFGIAGFLRQMFKRYGECEEFAQRVPAQMVFFEELLNMFRCRTARAGFKHTAAVHQWNDRQHFRACAEFQNWEQVGQVVAQDITGYGDGVFAVFQTTQAELGGFFRSEDADVEAIGIQFGKVGFNLGEQALVVRTVFVEPEHGRRVAQTGAVDGKLYPVFNRSVFGLAHTPDVAGFNVVLH